MSRSSHPKLPSGQVTLSATTTSRLDAETPSLSARVADADSMIPLSSEGVVSSDVTVVKVDVGELSRGEEGPTVVEPTVVEPTVVVPPEAKPSPHAARRSTARASSPALLTVVSRWGNHLVATVLVLRGAEEWLVVTSCVIDVDPLVVAEDDLGAVHERLGV